VTSDQLLDDLDAAIAAGDADAAAALATRLASADESAQKPVAKRVHTHAEDTPAAALAAVPVVEELLVADAQSVRLTATKAAGALAAARPTDVETLVDPLTERLDDDFYFVRGRASEALGHLAQATPGAIDRPVVLARLLNALSVDRSEIRQYVSEALARIAVGDPSALRTMTDDCAGHLADEDPLVRFHLATALALVARPHPGYCTGTVPSVADRLSDEEMYVRGRAAEILGLVALAHPDAVSGERARLADLTDDESFVADRARFACDALDGTAGDPPDELGDADTIAAGTADIVDDITTSDGSGCPHCGESLPESRPPFCPLCGAPLEH
jgi:HEAT repeat protein